MKPKNFGSETVVIGDEVERFFDLDGARIRTSSDLPIDETGTIDKILINRQTQTVAIWANMDKGYKRTFRPRQIKFVNGLLPNQAKLLSRGDKEDRDL
jgi:hypothetical protein